MSDFSADDPSAEQRSSTVCFLCRQRKTRCDRVLPSCGFCKKAGVDCQYVPQPKKRGLRAGYVTELESRIESLEGEVQEMKHGTVMTEFQSPVSQTSSLVDGTTPFPNTVPSFLASPVISPPHKRRRYLTESDAAVKDLASLPLSYLLVLGELWFKETQPWLPILSYQHISGALQALTEPVEYIEDIELRAIISLEIEHATQALVLGYEGRQRLSQHLRSQVMTEAMAQPSLSSIRALIIIGFLDYGMDNIPSVHNILSMCRRVAESLGLFRGLLHLIEHESPSQVGPPPRTAFNEDEGSHIAVVWAILGFDAVSSLGVPWRDVSADLVDHLSSVAYVSSPDLKDSYKAHTHLSAIGLWPVHTFLHDFSKGRLKATDDTTLLRCDEMYNNTLNYVHSQPSSSYVLLANGAVDFDPCLVHTSVLSFAAIILIYEVLIDFNTNTPEIAIDRCNQASDAMVMTIRSISDADAELNTPVLSHFFFVAARYKLVKYRALTQPREIVFDTLMHGINMCGRRWHVARRLDIVLRAAIFEVDTGQSSGLPKDFWNLKRSHLDISEQLKQSVSQHKSKLYVGAVSGPQLSKYPNTNTDTRIPDMRNRTERRAETRKAIRDQKETLASRSAYARKKETLERQGQAENINRKRAAAARGLDLPPEPNHMDALLDFTVNKKEFGYGWVVVVTLLVMSGIWQAWTSSQ